MRALAPFSPTPMSSYTTLIFIALHPKIDGYFSFFLENYEPDQNLELSLDSFILAPTHAPFIGKWFLWDKFLTHLRLVSLKRFNKWIPFVISTLFSYYKIPP
jgi:hypothetical protein